MYLEEIDNKFLKKIESLGNIYHEILYGDKDKNFLNEFIFSQGGRLEMYAQDKSLSPYVEIKKENNFRIFLSPSCNLKRINFEMNWGLSAYLLNKRRYMASRVILLNDKNEDGKLSKNLARLILIDSQEFLDRQKLEETNLFDMLDYFNLPFQLFYKLDRITPLSEYFNVPKEIILERIEDLNPH